MGKKRISLLFVMPLFVLSFMLVLVGCGKVSRTTAATPTTIKPTTQAPATQAPATLVVSGYDTAVKVKQDSQVSDSDLIAGVTATRGSETLTVYVVDKSNLNTANLGTVEITLGLKDSNGNVVSNATYRRNVTVEENFYTDINIGGNTTLTFLVDADIEDSDLLAGLTVNDGFTLYVKESDALDSSTSGDYYVTIGVKKGGKVVKSSATTEVTVQRKVSIVEPEPELNITFYFNDLTEIPNAFIELNETNDNTIKSAILAGLTAKDDDFNEYLVKIVDMSTLDTTTANTYSVTLGAYNGTELLKDKDGNDFTITRSVVVRAFEKLAAPSNFIIAGYADQMGRIRFDNVPEGAETYVVKFVAQGAESTAQAVCETTVDHAYVEMGFLPLVSGDYTMYVKAQGTGYLDSEFSAGYSITYTLFAEFTPEVIATWTNQDHGIPSLVNGVAKIETPIDGWGKAKSADIQVNFNKTVVLALDINKVDNAFFSTLLIDGSEISIIGDTRSGDPIMREIKATGYTGTQTVNIIVGPTGGGPAIYLNGVRVFSIEKYVAPQQNVQLANPSEFGVGVDGSSIKWTGDNLCETYSIKITKRGETTVIKEDTTDQLSYQVATLPKGDYTITVKCVGKAPLTTDSEEVSYDFSIKEYANFTAEQIGQFTGNGWEADSTVEYNSETGYAVINFDGHRSYGAVGNEGVTVDLSKKPVVIFEDLTITGGWLARAFFGTSTIYPMQNDTMGDAHYDYLVRKIWLNVDGNLIPGATGSKEEPQGVAEYRFLLGFVGGNDSRVTVKGMRFVYVQEYTEAAPEPLAKPKDFAPASSGSEIGWASNALTHEYTVYAFGTETVIASGTTNGASLEVASLPAGRYTLKVKGLGNNTETLDSEYATYDFAVRDLVYYSAADVANTSLFAVSDGNVSASATGNRVTITNNSDWGVWSPLVGTTLDLSQRPVIVVKGITLEHECWLARAYVGGTTIVMQNDTNGNWNNVTIIRRTWVNVDGNKINGNTGDANNPAGTVEYRFGIGVNGSGIVSYESIRIVIVTAYTDCGNNHDLKEVAEVPATCTTGGHNQYWVCDNCGKVFKADKTTETTPEAEVTEINPNNHSLEHINGTAAHGVAGYKEYWHCTACGKYYEDLAATKEINNIDTWKAEGGAGYVADAHVCNHTPQVNATCQATGIKEYWQCTECNKYFSDSAYTLEIADLEAWKAGDGLIAIADHALVEVSAKAPTCVETGNTQYWTCSVCSKVFKADRTTETTVEAETLPISDHSYGAPVYEWTFEGGAWKCTATRTCSVNSEHYETETVTSNSEVTTQATESTNGAITYTATFTNAAFETQTKVVTTTMLAKPANMVIRGGYEIGRIMFDAVENATGYEAILVALGENTSSTVLASMSSATNEVSFKTVFLPTGNYTLYIRAVSSNTEYVASNYSDGLDLTITVLKSWTAQEFVNSFTGLEHCQAVMVGDLAKVTPINDGWGYGRLNEELTIDFNKNPIVNFDIVSFTNAYSSFAFDGSTVLPLTGDTNDANIFPTSIYRGNVQGSGYTGVNVMRVGLGVTGGLGCEVYVRSAAVYYLTEYVEPSGTKDPVQTATDMTLSSNKMNITWTTDALSFEYTVYVKDTDTVVESGTKNGTNYSPAHLPAGQYTIKVKCLGDGENTLDATDYGTFNFQITDYISYSAADIAAWTRVAGEPTTAALSDDGTKAVITTTAWGIVAQQDPNTLASESSKFTGSACPILVIKGLTVKSGAWCLRAYVRGSANSYALTDVVMHNDDANSADLLVHPAWQNVDGNMIASFSGNNTNPGGYIRDYMIGLGATNYGTVEVESIRIVGISVL